MTCKIQEVLYFMSNKYNSPTDWLTISNKATVYTLVFSVAHRNSTCTAHNETGTLIINIAISILGGTDSMPNCDVRTEIKHHRVIQRRVTTGGHCRYHISSGKKKKCKKERTYNSTTSASHPTPFPSYPSPTPAKRSKCDPPGHDGTKTADLQET